MHFRNCGKETPCIKNCNVMCCSIKMVSKRLSNTKLQTCCLKVNSISSFHWLLGGEQIKFLGLPGILSNNSFEKVFQVAIPCYILKKFNLESKT